MKIDSLYMHYYMHYGLWVKQPHFCYTTVTPSASFNLGAAANPQKPLAVLLLVDHLPFPK